MAYVNKKLVGKNNCFVYLQNVNHRPDITKGNESKKLESIFGEPKLSEVPVVRIALDFFDSENIKTLFDNDVNTKFITEPVPDFVDLVYGKDKAINVINYTDGKAIYDSILDYAEFIIGGGFSIIQNGMENYEGIEHFPYYANPMPRTLLCSTYDDRFMSVIIDKGNNNSIGATAKDCYTVIKTLEKDLKVDIRNVISYFDGKYPEIIEYDTYLDKSEIGIQKNVKTAFILYENISPEYSASLPIVKKDGKYLRGIYIQLIQRILTHMGVNVGPLDGIIGDKTLNGIKDFQKKNKLVVDGIIGKNTWKLLLEYANLKK